MPMSGLQDHINSNAEETFCQNAGSSQLKSEYIKFKNAKKVYVVRKDEKGHKYIHKNRMNVFLKDIQGQYTYC